MLLASALAIQVTLLSHGKSHCVMYIDDEQNGKELSSMNQESQIREDAYIL